MKVSCFLYRRLKFFKALLCLITGTMRKYSKQDFWRWSYFAFYTINCITYVDNYCVEWYSPLRNMLYSISHACFKMLSGDSSKKRACNMIVLTLKHFSLSQICDSFLFLPSILPSFLPSFLCSVTVSTLGPTWPRCTVLGSITSFRKWS